jgi:hypothetical protein
MFIKTLLTTALALSTVLAAPPPRANNDKEKPGNNKDKDKHNINGTCPLTAVDPVEFPYPSKRKILSSLRVIATLIDAHPQTRFTATLNSSTIPRWQRSTGPTTCTLRARSTFQIVEVLSHSLTFRASTFLGEGIPIRKSTDRINWKFAGFVFPDGAPSVTDAYTNTTNGSLWAPDVVSDDNAPVAIFRCLTHNAFFPQSYHAESNQFVLYYSASSFGSPISGIFLATSPTGEPGSFTE